MSQVLLDHTAIEGLLDGMAQSILQRLQVRQLSLSPVMIVGIQSGGVWIAQALQQRLQLVMDLLPMGKLNINFYRDDFSEHGLHPRVLPSTLAADIDHVHVILVDDVLMSGRTVRAALNELFDYGRPASVMLVTLIDLDARQLPIQADVIGKHVALMPGQKIKLRGPVPLSVEMIEVKHDLVR
jgi:pyrimidine operon attenuation protein/uracil phosphoribosyltransferase